MSYQVLLPLLFPQGASLLQLAIPGRNHLLFSLVAVCEVSSSPYLQPQKLKAGHWLPIFLMSNTDYDPWLKPALPALVKLHFSLHINPGCHRDGLQAGWLSHRHLFSHSHGDYTFESKVLAELVSSEASVLG